MRSSASSSSSSIDDTETGASAIGNMKSGPRVLVGDCLPGDV